MKEEITLHALKLVVLFLSVYPGGNMYGVKIITALVVLGQFQASVNGENEVIALF